jgi:benzoate/toluate 1,2-dioxygenase subunit beta
MRPTRADAETLLYREARLLDTRRLKEWLELYTDDALYWVPASHDDDETAPAIIYDERSRMEERIFRLLDTPAYSQIPASRTIHTVGNVEVGDADEAGDTVVHCTLAVAEQRPGDPTQVGLASPRVFHARVEYRFAAREGRWLIRRKKILLLDRDLPVYNLTFVL